MKHQIFAYLKSAPGCVKRPELLQAIRVQANDLSISDRAMRKAIEEMIKDDGYLIASNEHGYHLIKGEEDLTEAMAYLDSKAASIALRKNCLMRNFRKQFKREPICQPLLFG